MDLQKIESEKIETPKKPGQKPDFSGDGVAVWINIDRNGIQYLSIQLLGKNGIKVNAFKNIPKD